MENLLISYFIFINFITLILMYLDKKRAIRKEYRIPERTLWIASLAGGSAGGLAGMQIFRHKTKKSAFRIGLPVLIVFHVFFIYYLWKAFF